MKQDGYLSVHWMDSFTHFRQPGYSRKNTENSIVQVGPFLDCSGFAVYSSQIEMEGKVSHSIGEYTIFSAIRPKVAIFTMLVPATGSIYWSEEYPGQLSTLLSNCCERRDSSYIPRCLK
ncbi:hypothetical protein P8452_12943 [Trifolium repens]|nr:hypothetical protein P8452_12943 [Trifolium repens]